MTLTLEQQGKQSRLGRALQDMITSLEVLYDSRVNDLYVGNVPLETFRQYYRQLVTLREAVMRLNSMSELNDPHNPIWFNARDTYYWSISFIRSGGQVANQGTATNASYQSTATDFNMARYYEALRKAGLL